MNTIPSKYHSQIKKMIKKDRETQKAEIIKMIEEMKNTLDEYRDAKYSFPTLEAVTKEIKNMSTK